MTHQDVWEETKREHGPIGRKLLLFPLVIFALLLVLAVSGKSLVSGSVAVGASSKQVAIASEWGTITIMGALAGYFVVSRALKIARFCHEMCERGQLIELARQNQASKP